MKDEQFTLKELAIDDLNVNDLILEKNLKSLFDYFNEKLKKLTEKYNFDHEEKTDILFFFREYTHRINKLILKLKDKS